MEFDKTAIEAAVRMLLSNHKNISYDELVSHVGNMINIYAPEKKEEWMQDIIDNLYLSIQQTQMGISELHSDDVYPWIKGKEIDFKFWKRYKEYLIQEDAKFPIEDLDKITDLILDKCVDPSTRGKWDRRGLVVGSVQSGKTANYIGLINKAIDAGYKFIVVIAGTLGSLRRQTQLRVDKGVIGRDSSDYIFGRTETTIGVGLSNIRCGNINSYTTSKLKNNNTDNGDFSASFASRLNFSLSRDSDSVIVVIKKNSKILENLINHMASKFSQKTEEGYRIIKDIPTLIIDDEADYASINTTNSLDELKTINRLIRTLVNLFEESTFIGYTATPYANLFIPQEFNDSNTTKVQGETYQIGPDLFPKHFIVNLHSTNMYVGATKFFGLTDERNEKEYEPLPLFRNVCDFEPIFPRVINSRNKFNLPDYLPDSLKEAMLSFILVCAIRNLRGHQNKHNSMLVHVASLIAWIDRVACLVNEQLNIYKNAIECDDENLLIDLENLYNREFVYRTKETIDNLDYVDNKIKIHTWNEIQKELKGAVRKIEVRAVHSSQKVNILEYQNIEEINYDKHKDVGLSIIAVGGNRLSRGITLEGLSISYFQRTTRMYDSLMQMGRWFGYRPGYVDLCRLYSSEEIFSWFEYINIATEEMRNDFDEMMQIPNQRPENFKLKVKAHPGMLIVTSLNKMYFSETINLSFSGTNPRTYEFEKSEKTLISNFEIYKTLFERLIKTNTKLVRINSNYLFRNVDISFIIEFLEKYITNQQSLGKLQLIEYIKLQEEIKEWNIGFISNTDSNVKIKYAREEKLLEANSFNFAINGIFYDFRENIRNNPLCREYNEYRLVKNQIDSTADRFIDLTEQYTKDKTIKYFKQLRNKEKKALLLLYSLDSRCTDNADFGYPFIGFSIHFPLIENEKTVKYKTSIYRDFDDMSDDDSEDN